jgi:transcriptional regulator of acetoin/glycerol metabolism
MLGWTCRTAWQPMDLDLGAKGAQSRMLAKAMKLVGGNFTEADRILGTARNRLYLVMNRAEDQ